MTQSIKTYARHLRHRNMATTHPCFGTSSIYFRRGETTNSGSFS